MTRRAIRCSTRFGALGPMARLAALVALVVSAAIAAGESAAAATDAAASVPPLRWATDAEGGAPYTFKDPKDPERNIGFEVDIIEALSREIGRPIEPHQYGFSSLILGVQRGDCDFAMNGLEVTPDRKEKVLFSRPYYVFMEQLVVRREEGRFGDLEGCRKIGCRVGTLEDTAADRMLKAQGIEDVMYDGVVEPYRDLALSRIDAVLLDLPIAVSYARPNPALRFAGEPFARGYYAIALPKQATALKAEIDAALDSMLADGRLRRIYEAWGMWNEAQEDL